MIGTSPHYHHISLLLLFVCLTVSSPSVVCVCVCVCVCVLPYYYQCARARVCVCVCVCALFFFFASSRSVTLHCLLLLRVNNISMYVVCLLSVQHSGGLFVCLFVGCYIYMKHRPSVQIIIMITAAVTIKRRKRRLCGKKYAYTRCLQKSALGKNNYIHRRRCFLLPSFLVSTHHQSFLQQNYYPHREQYKTINTNNNHDFRG